METHNCKLIFHSYELHELSNIEWISAGAAPGNNRIYNSVWLMRNSGIVLIGLVAVAAITLFSLSSSSHLTEEQLPQCVTRSTMLARAQDWVDKHVPYNQQGSYDGYRTDCSGFVSMSWELAKPGLTTSTLHTASSNITKDQLLVGDAMICEGHHVVFFGGWSDAGKTHYYALE